MSKPDGIAAENGAVLLLIVTCVLSCVPVFGFVMYALGWLLLLVAFILCIVAMAQGRTVSGIFALLCVITIGPAGVIFGPLLSTGLVWSAQQSTQPAQQAQTAHEQPASTTPVPHYEPERRLFRPQTVTITKQTGRLSPGTSVYAAGEQGEELLVRVGDFLFPVRKDATTYRGE